MGTIDVDEGTTLNNYQLSKCLYINYMLCVLELSHNLLKAMSGIEQGELSGAAYVIYYLPVLHVCLCRVLYRQRARE